MTTTTDSNTDLLTSALAAWRAQVEKELAGADFTKKLVARTAEGIAVPPLFTRRDTAGIPELAVNDPTAWPIRRGRGGRARVAQRLRAADAVTWNTRLRADLMVGQDAVSVTPEEGPTLADANAWQAAMAGLDFTAVPLYLVTEASPRATAARWLAWATGNDQNPAQFSGAFTSDPWRRWARTGAAPSDWAAEWDEQAAWLPEAATALPGVRALGVDVSPWHAAGATAGQELGLALAAAVETLRALTARGTGVEAVARSLQVTLAIGPRFFTEVAKFRAWRVLWARVLTAASASADAALGTALHAVGGERNKTALDPLTNVLRITTEGLAASLGGVDALHLPSHDVALGGEDERARRLARNVQIMLTEEFHLGDTIDAAGGSWYVEWLTEGLARGAWTFFQEIERRGGLAAAWAEGWPQGEVARAAAASGKAFATRRQALIGTNLFPAAGDPPPAPDATRPPGALPATRLAEPVEALRRRAAALTPRPTVHLVRMGPVKQHKARADFTSGFLAVGGFKIIPGEAHATAEAAVAAVLAAGARLTVLCSTDDTYAELVPAFAGAVKAAAPDTFILLAGRPADPAGQAAYRAAGIDEFLYLGADVVALNTRCLDLFVSAS
jgi:methylmalonyl-CoA mutase